jgi:formylglycine-generating enzyme required for sulfatase activity
VHAGLRKTLRILFVAANSRSRDLALDEEYRAIEQSLRSARYRGACQLIACLAARRDDVQAALLEHRPDVVHFACHGSSRAEVLLASRGPGSETMSAEALASLFGVLKDNIALVVFNVCFGSAHASAIQSHVGFAIGMREQIEDDTATVFASALYGALAYGRSVRDAFDLGVAAVEAVDPRRKHVPQLFVDSGSDASVALLVERPWPRVTWVWVVGAMLLASILALASVVLRSLADPGGHATKDRLPEPLNGKRRSEQAAPGMVRFRAARMQPGVFASSERPTVCTELEKASDCAVLADPEQIGSVAVQSFDLDAMEVTNGDYARWLMRNSDRWVVTRKGVIKTPDEPGVSLVLASDKCGGGLLVVDHRVAAALDKVSWPVVCVTWHGASEYCRAHGKRLPLEAEWEWATKGDGGRPFPWGSDLPRQDGVVFDLSDGASAHPRDAGSASQDVSPEGVRDLGGNVTEWVEDGRASSTKTVRGGNWASQGPCQVLGSSCKRVTQDATASYAPNIGFRCASSVIEPGEDKPW